MCHLIISPSRLNTLHNIFLNQVSGNKLTDCAVGLGQALASLPRPEHALPLLPPTLSVSPMDVISASPPPSYDDVPPLTPPEAPSLPLSLNSLAQSQSGPLSSSSSYSASAVLTPIRRSQLQTTSSTRTMSSSSSSPDEDSELSEGDPGYLDPADFPEDVCPHQNAPSPSSLSPPLEGLTSG